MIAFSATEENPGRVPAGCKKSTRPGFDSAWKAAGESMYPDFLVIGAQKAGTIWLQRNVQAHPEIWPSREKGLGYFDEKIHDPANPTGLRVAAGPAKTVAERVDRFRKVFGALLAGKVRA